MAANIEKKWKFVDEETPDEEKKWKFVDEETPKKKVQSEFVDEQKGPYSTPYDVPEEDIARSKDMTVSDRWQLAEDLNTERQFRQSKGITRGTLSGPTLGLSENIPGLKKQEGDLGFEAAEFASSMAPMTGIFALWNVPLKMAQKLPYLKRTITSVGNVLKSAGVGATEEALREAFKGEVPDIKKVASKSAEWGAIDAVLQAGGVAGRAVGAYLKKNTEIGKKAFEVVENMIERMTKKGVDFNKIEEVSEKALEYVESEGSKLKASAEKVSKVAEVTEGKVGQEAITPKSLSEKKITQQIDNKINTEIRVEPQRPEVKPPKPLKGQVGQPVQEQTLDSMGKRAKSKESLGKDVRKSVDSELEKAEAVYTPLYEEATKEAQTMRTTTSDLHVKAFRKMEDVGRFKTSPENYSKVEKIIENVLDDTGVSFNRDAEGKIESFASLDIPITDLMEVGRRLGRIVKYDTLDKGVMDILKGVQKDVKAAIGEGLKPNEKAYEAWNAAEKAFQEKSQRFNNPIVRKVRNKDTGGESVSKLLEKPSALSDVKKVVDPKTYKQIERELLSEMNDMSYAKAQKTFRELEPHLSEEAKFLADEILLTKKPSKSLTAKDRNQLTERWVVNSFSKPGPPSDIISQWSTQQGRSEITKSLRKNPNKESIIEYLQKDAAATFASEITDASGTIDFKKVDGYFKKGINSQTVADVGGKDAVSFFKNVENMKDNFERSGKVFENLKKNNKDVFETAAKLRDGQKITDTTKLANWEKYKSNQVSKATQTFDRKVKAIKSINSANSQTTGRGNEILNNAKDKIRREKFPIITGVEDIWNSLGPEGKAVLKNVGGVTTVVKGKTITTAAVLGGAKLVSMMAENPRLRYVIREALNAQNTNPYQTYMMLRLAEEIIKEEK